MYANQEKPIPAPANRPVPTRPDRTLASRVAEGLGLALPAKLDVQLNESVPADADPKKFQKSQVEETEMFPRVRKLMPHAELVRLGEDLMRAKAVVRAGTGNGAVKGRAVG